MSDTLERPLYILAIDDEQVVLDSIQKHLRKENCRMFAALSVQQALAVMDAHSIDIVITDLMMPRTDGLDCLRLLKDRSPHTPVIMLTGFATIHTALQAMRLGSFDYIAKPFTKAELLTVIRRAAELVRAFESSSADGGPSASPRTVSQPAKMSISVSAHSWTKLEEDGTVLMGVKPVFLDSVGAIRNVYLPAVGDELRQGSICIRMLSSDLRTHAVLSPLSGTVVELNECVLKDPVAELEDSHGQMWLLRLKPSMFEFEIGELEL
jgi:CheY-like chemotaxis protein/glycine cleavage system H lipoate-binding protein